MENATPYTPKNKVRIVTAASLFDGHDAAINIMRRIMQRTGCEVIHLGHDRSVDEVVTTAIQEDAQAIAMTSYQGGHMEYFKYMKDLLDERGAGHIRVFGGGGGTILPEEIEELHAYGIARIYHPDDGRAMGLQGMINDLIEKADFNTVPSLDDLDGAMDRLGERNVRDLARCITAAENNAEAFGKAFEPVRASLPTVPVLGITGTGGAGKSSMVDELVRRFLLDFPEKRIALVSVDPSKRKTGGALLGDRIRMNAIHSDRVYMRSLATRQSNLALSRHVQEALDILKAAQFDLIVLETSGIGQSDTEIMDHSDVSLYVMTPEFGAATQLEKIDMLDFADVVAINKFDKRGRARRAARRPQTIQAQPRFVGSPRRRTARGGHHRVAVQRPRHQRALPPHDEHAGGKDRRGADVNVCRRARHQRKGLHHSPCPHALPQRNRRDQPCLRPVGGQASGPCRTSASRANGLRRSGRPSLRRFGCGAKATRARFGRPPLRLAPSMARASSPLCRLGIRLSGAWKGHSDSHHKQVALSPGHPQGRPSRTQRLARPRQMAPAGKPARLLPLHRRHLPLQARRRRPHAHVRGRRRSRAHQQALPLRLARHAGQALVHGLRFSHAVRPRPRPAPGHLRQGGQLRGEHLLPRRREEALQRV